LQGAYHCWSEGECKLDLSAVFLLLDDWVNCRGKAAFLKHSLQGDAESSEVQVNKKASQASGDNQHLKVQRHGL